MTLTKENIKKLTPRAKQRAWTAGTNIIKFIQDLKKHIQISDNIYTQHRSAFALTLLSEYIDGEFLKQIQGFKLSEDLKEWI